LLIIDEVSFASLDILIKLNKKSCKLWKKRTVQSNEKSTLSSWMTFPNWNQWPGIHYIMKQTAWCGTIGSIVSLN
jgi:hypothetical protein